MSFSAAVKTTIISARTSPGGSSTLFIITCFLNNYSVSFKNRTIHFIKCVICIFVIIIFLILIFFIKGQLFGGKNDMNYKAVSIFEDDVINSSESAKFMFDIVFGYMGGEASDIELGVSFLIRWWHLKIKNEFFFIFLICFVFYWDLVF